MIPIRLQACLLLPFLLSGCCLSGAAQPAWRLFGYWQPVFDHPELAAELLMEKAQRELAQENGGAAEPMDADKLRKFRRAARSQIAGAQTELERELRQKVLRMGWVLPSPDSDTQPGLELHYTFTVFSPMFRRFSLSGFFKNLLNPLPGAAIIGAFPFTGGEYELNARLLDCQGTELANISLYTEGLGAFTQLAEDIFQQLAATPVRLPRACRPPQEPFFGRLPAKQSL